MDDKTIYDKTPAGEEAVRERTRLVQRNLRMVLIIVDGQVDVAELKRKGGDAVLVESALAELERMGLITVVPTGEGAEAIRPEPPPEEVEAPAPEPVVAPVIETLPPVEIPPPVESQPPVPKVRRPSPLAVLAARWREFRQKRRAAKEDEVFEQAFEEEAVELPPKAESIKVRFKPSGRRGRPWAKAIGGLAGLAAVLVLGLLLFPYGTYRESIERQASAALGDVVKIGDVGLSFAPWPTLALQRVTVGAEPYATAATVRLSPELGSLFGERKAMREVQVEGLQLEGRGIGPAARWFAGEAAGKVRIGRLTLTDMSMSFGALQAEKWSGELNFGSAGELTGALLRNTDGNGQVEAKPADGGFGVQASFTGWKAPFRESLRFSSLDLAGVVGPLGFRLNKIDGAALDGRLQGQGNLTWDRSLALTADLALKHVDLAGLLDAFGMPELVGGPADGAMRVSCKGAGLGRLLDQASAEGRFEVGAGTLQRLGIVEALRGNGRGSTRFERLSGTLAVSPNGVRLDKLQLSSGALRADGWLEAAADGRLSGRLNAELRGAGGGRASLSVSGTAADPLLKK